MTVQDACQKAAEIISAVPYHVHPDRDEKEIAELLEALESIAQGHGTIVASGNAFDGLTLFGPFSDGEEANEWAGEVCRDDWHSMAVLDPSSHPV